jgi:hypothetical protein
MIANLAFRGCAVVGGCTSAGGAAPGGQFRCPLGRAVSVNARHQVRTAARKLLWAPDERFRPTLMWWSEPPMRSVTVPAVWTWLRRAAPRRGCFASVGAEYDDPRGPFNLRVMQAFDVSTSDT